MDEIKDNGYSQDENKGDSLGSNGLGEDTDTNEEEFEYMDEDIKELQEMEEDGVYTNKEDLSEDEVLAFTSVNVHPSKASVASGGGSGKGGSGSSGGGTGPGTGTHGNYKKRKLGLIPFINEFQRDFTINCFKRTTPINYTLPFSFGRILLGVSALCKGESATQAIPLRDAITFLGSSDGGGMKTGDTVRKDLCRMTADPFPLLQSAKDKNETGAYRPMPLYSMADGLCAAERYSKVGLSYLGSIAVGKYYKLYGRNIRKIKGIKTIVPLALLRKKTVPWTLGHKAVNYSYNPSELFMLQAKMLDASADPNNQTPWILPDNDVAEIFKGPDVGRGYIGYMTNRSLMSTYHLGKGSVTIVPNIIIDRTEKTITFEVPPLGMISNEFVKYLNFKLIGKDPDSGKEYPKFTSFDFKRTVDESGVKVVIRDVVFIKSDESIINELHADPIIRVTSPLINTVLLNSDGTNEIEANVLEQNIQDSASEDFVADVMPIHELLWQHICDEYDVRVELLKREIAELREKLEVDLFLEKVTRPEVAKYIYELHDPANKNIFKDLLHDNLGEYSSKRNPDYLDILPEGFKNWEIDEIASESTKNTRTGLVILNVMYHRNKYENRWKKTQDDLDKLDRKLNDNAIIRSEIKADLLTYARLNQFQRLTKMYFVEELRANEVDIDYDFSFNTDVWDTLYLPCTLYHNGRYLVKSYGRNINYVPKSEREANMKFSEALNATTDDTFYIFSKDTFQEYHMSQVPCSPVDVGNIDAIIPHSDVHDILVTIESVVYSEDHKGYIPSRSSYFVVPAGGPKTLIRLESGDRIKGWCYLNKKYVEFIGHDPIMDKQTYGKILSSQIPRNAKITPYPKSFDPIMDIMATDDEGSSVQLVSNSFDGTVLDPEKMKVEWRSEMDADTLHLLHESEFASYFGSHIEYYLDKMYMTDWKRINMVVHEYFSHGKKSLINELIWCRPNDTISNKMDSMISHKVNTFRDGLNLMISHCTSNYEEYNVGYLSDWSVINPRFQLPTCRPENDDYVAFYNDYLEKMYTCKVSSKEFKEISKQMEDIKTKIIAESTNNPFISEVQVNVPNMVDINDDYFNDEDNDLE